MGFAKQLSKSEEASLYCDVHILWALEERCLRWCVRWVFLGHLFNPHNAIYDLIVDVSIIIIWFFKSYPMFGAFCTFEKCPQHHFLGQSLPTPETFFPRQSRKKTHKLTFLRFNFWKHWKSKKGLHSRNRSILLTVGELMTAFVMDLLPHRDYSQNNCYETNRPCFRQLHGGGDAKYPLKDRCSWVALI